MITADAQQLEPGGRVTVYELDCTSFGADQLWFHAHLQSGVIWWQGQEYGAWPIEATGFERTSDQPPNPRLRVGNLDGRISAMCLMFGDLVGARLIRRQTLVRYLDRENFPGQNLLRWSADPTQSVWALVSATRGPAAPQSAFGINFIGQTVISGNATWNRLENQQAGTSAMFEAGDSLVVTGYARYGSSGRVQFLVRDISTNTIGGVQFDNGTYLGSTTALGSVTLLQSSVENGVQMAQFRIELNRATRLGASIGPFTTTVGATVVALGMQVEKAVRPQGFFITTTASTFTGGYNPNADPNEHFLDEVWFIERKVSETKELVEFELTTAIDLNGEQLPGRQVIAGVCGWLIRGGYRGPYCGYTGPAVADANDVPTNDPSSDQCGGRVGSCKLRFGTDKPLPYGGFPAAGLLRT